MPPENTMDNAELPTGFKLAGFAATVSDIYNDGTVTSESTLEIDQLNTIAEAHAWIARMSREYLRRPMTLSPSTISVRASRKTGNHRRIELHVWPLDAQEIAANT